MSIRIGLVTDIHLGVRTSPAATVVSEEAFSLLADVATEMNQRRVDVVVNLGDALSETGSREHDFERLRLVRDALGGVGAPVFHLLGNRDVMNLTPQEVIGALNGRKGKAGSESFTLGGFELLFWQANVERHVEEDGSSSLFTLSRSDLDWLRTALGGTDLPCVLFTHVPLDEQSMVGNHYFHGEIGCHSGYENASCAREIIAASGKVVAAVAGHVHWTTMSAIDDTVHFTLHPLAESFTTGGEPAGAWALLDLTSGRAALEVFGKEPLKVERPIRYPTRRWPRSSRTLRDIAEHVRQQASHLPLQPGRARIPSGEQQC